MSSSTYVCECCQKTYGKNTCPEYEKEAYAEFLMKYPEMKGERLSIVCENCVVKYDKWMDSLTADQRLKMRDDMRRENEKLLELH